MIHQCKGKMLISNWFYFLTLIFAIFNSEWLEMNLLSILGWNPPADSSV